MSKPLPFAATIEVRDACLCLHVQRAARALARRFDEALRPVGITSGQFSLLNALNRPEPPSIGPVAQLLAMDRTTLTAALKPLERNGFVTISVDPEDRRNRRLRLTAEGHRVLNAAVPIWRETHNALEERLPDIDPDALRTSLKILSQPVTPEKG